MEFIKRFEHNLMTEKQQYLDFSNFPPYRAEWLTIWGADEGWMEFTGHRIPKDFFTLAWMVGMGWKSKRIQGPVTRLFPWIKSSLEKLHPEGREVLKPDYICSRKSILTFYILFFLGQVQCQITKIQTKFKTKMMGEGSLGRAGWKTKGTHTMIFLIRKDKCNNCF